MNIETLKLMDRQHAINALLASFDPLTATELERFLLEQVEKLNDERTEYAELVDALNDSDMDIPTVIEYLNAIGEAGIDSPAELRLAIESSTV